MILGRNPALWLALVQATLNVLVIVAGVPWDANQLAALNVFGVAVVGIVANSSDPSTAGTFEATTQAPTEAAPGAPGKVGGSGKGGKGGSGGSGGSGGQGSGG